MPRSMRARWAGYLATSSVLSAAFGSAGLVAAPARRSPSAAQVVTAPLASRTRNRDALRKVMWLDSGAEHKPSAPLCLRFGGTQVGNLASGSELLGSQDLDGSLRECPEEDAEARVGVRVAHQLFALAVGAGE